MTQAGASGLGTNWFSRSRRDTLERNVPSVRLEDDADLGKIYTFGRTLGQGSFGVVYEATHIKAQTKWAIKEVCRPAAGNPKVEMLDQEINILKQVNHSHIIHLHEIYQTAKKIYMVTELCVGGDLQKLLQHKKFLTEIEARDVICGLADAVAYLHSKDIIHRDLKLENILVKNSLDEDDNGRIHIKVIDFGLSVQTDIKEIGNTMKEACGTLAYMAPEMMSGRGYTHWCDLWSIGIIMYMLLCGEPPFASKTKSGHLEECKKGVKFTQTVWNTVSDAAKKVLMCLLNVDPAYRMSASQLLGTRWITDDPNVPAVPLNALEMMRDRMELDKRTQTLEGSSEYAPDLFPLPRPDSTENTTNHIRSTDTKVSQQEHKDNPETSGFPQPFVTQSHPVKLSALPSAKQRRRGDKKGVTTAQRPASGTSRRL